MTTLAAAGVLALMIGSCDGGTPGVVQDLQSVNATEDSISLAWDPPENAGAVGIDRYEVVREIPRLPDASFSVAEAAFTDTGLDPETEYRYRVRAISFDGEEGAEIDLLASTSVAVPDPPGSVLELRSVHATENSISLAWDPPANAGSVLIDQYEVIREIPRLPDESFSVAEAAFTDARLQADSQYRYRVRAISVDGVEGPAVDLAASTLKPTSETEKISPGTVRNLRAVSKQYEIKLAWDPPANADVVPIDRYKISRLIALRPDEVFFVGDPEFIDKGLAAGSEYRYRVNAIGMNGASGAEIDLVASTSDSTGETEPQVPDPVRNLTASIITNNSITLTWDPPKNAAAASVNRYEVARVVRFLPDERVSVAETTFTDTQLSAGSQYRYRVRAINRNGAAGQAVDLLATTLES